MVTVVQSCEGGSEVTCTTVVSAGGGWGGRHGHSTTTSWTRSPRRTYRLRRCSVAAAPVAVAVALAVVAAALAVACLSDFCALALVVGGIRAAPTQTHRFCPLCDTPGILG